MNQKRTERKWKSIPDNLSSFIHFTLEVVFIELFLKIDTWEMGNDTTAKWEQKGEWKKVDEWRTADQRKTDDVERVQEESRTLTTLKGRTKGVAKRNYKATR